ncbi:MAG: hypothetical protein N3C12_16055 [Candidatus Binatia bacterium]|nr:hypothetical protein [Candidatus Binatia bacterium]
MRNRSSISHARSRTELPKLLAAVLLTTVIAALQRRFVLHAGGLWRDEANSANLVALRDWWSIWEHARYDSFPLLWNALVWLLGNAGWTDDTSLRQAGLLMGWAQLAALWCAARVAAATAPLLALALYALSPSTIVYGSMFRGYGLSAAVFLLATAGLIHFLRSPTRSRAAVLALANIAAVQANFANGVLLAATHAAAALVFWPSAPHARRIWAGLAVAFGAATLSLGLSWHWIAYAFEVGSAEQRPVTLTGVARVWWESLGTALPAQFLLWLAALAIVVGGSARCLRSRAASQPECVLALAALIGLAGFLVYFRTIARLPSQEWHYFSLNALLALAAEANLAHLLVARPKTAQWFVLAMLASAAAVTAWQDLPSTKVRATNADLIAAAVAHEAAPTDLVVVAPWYCGISFGRYYRGQAPWMTLPDIPDRRFHYHLQIRAKIARGSQGIAAERQRIEDTLQSGHRVWLVGDLSAPPPGHPVPTMPPGPHPVTGWRAGPYLEAWEQEIAVLLREHATGIWAVELPDTQPINRWENLRLTVIEGWRSH